MRPFIVGLILFFAAVAQAQPRPAAAPADSPPPEPFKPVVGPATVQSGHDVVIDLPAGFLFLDTPQAKKLMERNGNLHNDDLLGVIGKADADWLVTVRFTEDGYVKDDDAAKLDGDEILKQIREGTDEANKERQERGFPAMHVDGWSEPPRYERDVHHLVWGIRATSDGHPGQSINFNTRVLGRKGFVGLNLIDDAEHIEADKPNAATLLAATHYQAGARYEDFDRKNDKVAEYGLTALVLGGAGLGALKLVKIGLLAKFSGKILALLIAFKKGVVLLLLGIGAWARRLFGAKKAAPPSTESMTVTAATMVPNDPSAAEQPAAERDPGGQHGT
ncbi:MAG TPA: DUF2167 domain-containing protein [Polyangia bacterium]